MATGVSFVASLDEGGGRDEAQGYVQKQCVLVLKFVDFKTNF